MTNADAVFEALGDPTRRRIFERVARHPSSVGELADGLPVSRPAVSQHLKVLAEAGLVKADAVGTRRIYRLEAKGITAMRRWLDVLWDDALDAFARVVEEDGKNGDGHERRNQGGTGS